jgi:cytochrome b561
MKTNNWSLPTRLLHLGMVLTISFQLFISLIMAEPDHNGSELGRLAFEAHEIVGLTALTIVLLHWIWSLSSQFKGEGGINHLFPWFGHARQTVIRDINDLLKGKFPQSGNKGGLAGLIHGLGLLAVSGIAITGGLLFVLFPETGKPGMVTETFAELHEGLATLVWTYWIGHGGIAILHHIIGHDTLKNMFNFSFTNKRKENNNHHKRSINETA